MSRSRMTELLECLDVVRVGSRGNLAIVVDVLKLKALDHSGSIIFKDEVATGSPVIKPPRRLHDHLGGFQECREIEIWRLVVF